MKYHPTTGTSSLDAYNHLVEQAHGDLLEVQEAITKQIAYAISVFEREFWQEVLSYLPGRRG